MLLIWTQSGCTALLEENLRHIAPHNAIYFRHFSRNLKEGQKVCGGGTGDDVTLESNAEMKSRWKYQETVEGDGESEDVGDRV